MRSSRRTLADRLHNDRCCCPDLRQTRTRSTVTLMAGSMRFGLVEQTGGNRVAANYLIDRAEEFYSNSIGDETYEVIEREVTTAVGRMDLSNINSVAPSTEIQLIYEASFSFVNTGSGPDFQAPQSYPANSVKTSQDGLSQLWIEETDGFANAGTVTADSAASVPIDIGRQLTGTPNSVNLMLVSQVGNAVEVKQYGLIQLDIPSSVVPFEDQIQIHIGWDLAEYLSAGANEGYFGLATNSETTSVLADARDAATVEPLVQGTEFRVTSTLDVAVGL